MNKFEIKITRDKHSETIDFFIDGRNLLERLKEHELPYEPNIAGSYGVLETWELAPSELLKPTGEDRLLIYGCTCGSRYCWPMEIRIQISDGTVTWYDFCQEFREDWDYSNFGPFIFDRKEYEREVGKLPTNATPPIYRSVDKRSWAMKFLSRLFVRKS